MLSILLAMSFVCVVNTTAFATSYEQANIVIGPNSTDGDAMRIDTKNYALEALKGVMSAKDFLLAMVYVSDYRKGDKSVVDSLTTLVSNYNIDNAKQIVNYILQDGTIELLGSYSVDHTTNTVSFVEMKGLTNGVTTNLDTIANVAWQSIVNFVPKEFSNSITKVHLEYNKDMTTLITMHESSTDASTWELNMDVSLLDAGNKDELIKYLIYITTFYYCLRTDQIEFLSPKKGNYVYQEKSYKDDSYINRFYKKFWKGRRKEVNTVQYDLYKNEFLDEKASRSVYDDMAVSFENYVRKGIMKRYLGFRADKTNFFDDYPKFRELAKEFRLKLNIPIS